MSVSGNINESVQFQVDGAGLVTGVKFGEGLANFSVVGTGVIEAAVPKTATWDRVTFLKQNLTEVFEVSVTGDENNGAYLALTGEINNLGYYDPSSGCSTGEVVFSDYNAPSGVCVITATGASGPEASGKMLDVYGSGLCGGPTGFSSGGYAASETRLSGISVGDLGDSSNFVAIGLVEHTGSLNVKQASSVVTCLNTNVQSQTDYKFVPIPEINYFTYAANGGGEISIYGDGFSGVSGVSLGVGNNIAFNVLSNTTISGQVPTGVFDDYIYLSLQSGVSVSSPNKYITSGETSGFVESSVLFVDDKRVQVIKGDSSIALVNGSGFKNLTEVYFLNFNSQRVDATGISGFSYTSGQLFAPISGLTTGSHDLIVSTATESVTGQGFVSVVDAPSTSYSYESIMKSGFNYVSEHSTETELASFLNAEIYGFEVPEESDRISLEISGGQVSGGSVTFELNKKINLSKTVNNSYTIKGNGLTSGASATDANNKWESGIYTLDQWAMPYDGEHSYTINSRVCGIESSGTVGVSKDVSFSSTGLYTGEVIGNPESLPLVISLHSNNNDQHSHYAGGQNLSCVSQGSSTSSGAMGVTATGEGVYVSASGHDPDGNITHINGTLSSTGSFSGYVLISTTTGIIDNYEAFNYTSGINFPYSTDALNDMAHQIWSNLLTSGVNDLYPEGWTGQHSLASGFAITTGTPVSSGEITLTGISLGAATTGVINEVASNYSQCQTGDPTYFTSGEVVNITKTGYFYGYC